MSEDFGQAMMSELVAFLNGCLDEHERIARTIIEDGKKWDGRQWLKLDVRTEHKGTTTIRHLKVYEPESALADVAAKRAIISYHSGSHECSGPDDNCMWILHEDDCPTLRALACAYSHHDGYLEEWKPND